MRRSIVLNGLVLFAALVVSMVICSGAFPAGKDYPVPKECMDQVRKEGNKLNIFDWAEWWPEKIFEGFSEEFGVKVTRDHYASADEVVSKFKLNPKAPYDLVTGNSPHHFLQMKEIGVLRKINHDWIPNVNHYLTERIKNLEQDPGYQYSVIDAIYFTTYVYNKKYVDPNDPRVGSWKLLFEGKDFAGRMTMIESWFESIGSALKYLGFSYVSDDEAELMKAREVLLRQKPWLMAYDAWPSRLVLEEEAWISHLWSGDGWFLHKNNPNVMSVLPSEGTYMGTDTSFLPIGGPHPATSHLFLNYLFRPQVYALLIETIAYAPVHKGALDLLSEELKAWPGVLPSEDYMDKCDVIDPKAVSGKGLELRTKIWEDVKK